jgi:hypothetical protein
MTRPRSLHRLWFTRRRVNHSLCNHNWPPWGLDNFYGFFFNTLKMFAMCGCGWQTL